MHIVCNHDNIGGSIFYICLCSGTFYDLKLSLEHLDTISYDYKDEKIRQKTVKKCT